MKNMHFFLILIFCADVAPMHWIRQIAESPNFDNVDNYLPKLGDLPKYKYSTNEVVNMEDMDDLDNSTNKHDFQSKKENDTIHLIDDNNENGVNRTKIRPSRQDNESSEESSEESSDNKNTETAGNSDEGSSEERLVDSDEEDEEEPENMFTDLLGAFLSGLSKADGRVDVEAIVSLLGSLSVQNPDGTFDFTGLTEVLRTFFGGDIEDGGSDFAAFVAGFLGAFLRGVANPPGPRGVGGFAGTVVTGILPALKPEPAEEGEETVGNPMGMNKPIDLKGFLTGFLTSALGGLGEFSGGSSPSQGSAGSSDSNSNNLSANSTKLSGNMGNGSGMQGFPMKEGGSKFPFMKAIFRMISSMFSGSSSQAN